MTTGLCRHRSQFVRTVRGALALVFGVSLTAALAQTGSWPSRPIRLIVPLAAGGGSDVASRVVAQYLGEALGQSVLVENKVGANGVVGIAEAVRAAPDGYTIVSGSSTTLAANNFLYKNSTVDPFRDFTPLAMLGTIDFGLMVPASSKYHTLSDLVADAKANPGKLSYGFGSSAALICGEMFNAAAGVNIVKVAYKGSPQSLTDLVADRVQLVCDPMGTSMPLIKAGKLRPLAVTGKSRNRLEPSVPTMGEAGVPLEHETWAGFFAPAGTPPQVAQRLSNEIIKIMGRPDVQARIIETGFIPRTYSRQEFAAIHHADYARMERLIKAAGISPE